MTTFTESDIEEADLAYFANFNITVHKEKQN
jgi:hypothetical protein